MIQCSMLYFIEGSSFALRGDGQFPLIFRFYPAMGSSVPFIPLPFLIITWDLSSKMKKERFVKYIIYIALRLINSCAIFSSVTNTRDICDALVLYDVYVNFTLCRSKLSILLPPYYSHTIIFISTLLYMSFSSGV